MIFTTAYSDREYLMSAIKLSAVDYLLKPVGKAELALAIAKVRERAKASAAALPGGQQLKLSFKSVNCKLFFPAEDIAWFKAEGNYATIVTFHGEHLVLENLLSLEQRLPADRFLRVDRSTIVNIGLVCRVDPQQHSCTLRSSDGRSLELKLSGSGTETLLAAV